MVPVIALLFTTSSMQAPAITQPPTPPSVLYSFTLFNTQGRMASPSLRTLDKCEAEISESGSKATFDIKVKPELNSDGTLTTKLALSLNKTVIGAVTYRSIAGEVFDIVVAKPIVDKEGTTYTSLCATRRTSGLRHRTPKRGEVVLEVSANLR